MEIGKKDLPITILLTAPFPALREGLKSLIESDGTVSVGEISASPSEWGSHLSDHEMIVAAPIGPVTAEWMKEISARSPGKPILYLLSHALATTPSLGSPIWGALPYSATGQEIILAIHALVQGLWIASPAVLPDRHLPSFPVIPTERSVSSEPLTDREISVLQCLAQGYTNKEAALYLGISTQTIKFHVSSIFSKLGVNNRTEAVSAGVKNGWVTL